MGKKNEEGEVDARLAAAYAIEARDIFGQGSDDDDDDDDGGSDGDDDGEDEEADDRELGGDDGDLLDAGDDDDGPDGDADGEDEGGDVDDDDDDDGIPDLDDLDNYAATRAKDRRDRDKDSELAELRREIEALKTRPAGTSFTAEDFKKDPAGVLKAMGLSQREALQVLTSRTLNPGMSPLEERLAKLERASQESQQTNAEQAQAAGAQALKAAERAFEALTDQVDEDSKAPLFPELARLPPEYRVALATREAKRYAKKGLVLSDVQLAEKLEKHLARKGASRQPAEDAGQAKAAKGGKGKGRRRRKPKSMTGNLAPGSTTVEADSDDARLAKAKALWEAS